MNGVNAFTTGLFAATKPAVETTGSVASAKTETTGSVALFNSNATSGSCGSNSGGGLSLMA